MEPFCRVHMIKIGQEGKEFLGWERAEERV